MASRVRLQQVLLVLALAIALPLIARATIRRAIAPEIKEKPTMSQASEQDRTRMAVPERVSVCTPIAYT